MAIPRDEYSIWESAIMDVASRTAFPHKSLRALNSAFDRCPDGTLEWSGKHRQSMYKITILSDNHLGIFGDRYEEGDRALLAIIVQECLTDPMTLQACGAEPSIKIATRSTIGHAEINLCGRWVSYDPDSDTLVPCCRWLVWWINDDLPKSAAEQHLSDDRVRHRANLAATNIPALPLPSRVVAERGEATGDGYAGIQESEEGVGRERDELVNSLADLQRELQRVTKERDELQASVTTLRSDLADAEQDRSHLKTTVATCNRAYESRRNRANNLVRKLVEEREALAICSKERDELKAALGALAGELDGVMSQSLQPVRDGVQQFADALRKAQIAASQAVAVANNSRSHSDLP